MHSIKMIIYVNYVKQLYFAFSVTANVYCDVNSLTLETTNLTLCC